MHITAKDIDRFWDKVEINPLPDGCWLWTAACFSNGYGAFRFRDRQLKAHRFAYAAFVGPLADDELVCHRCDIKTCVNPSHLFAGSQKANIADMLTKGRQPNYVENARQKLSDDDVRAIRLAVASGEYQRVIAARYGVSQTMVSQIALGKKWHHVI